MNRVLGITSNGVTIEFECIRSPVQEGKPAQYILPSELNDTAFWNNGISLEKCARFWSEKINLISGKIHFSVAITAATNYVWLEQPHENFHSLQLAVLMAPLSENIPFDIPYSTIYFTGQVFAANNELFAGRVVDCQQKYDAVAKNRTSENKQELRAFVYVSSGDEIISPDHNSGIIPIHIDHGTPLTDIINMLSNRISYPIDKISYFGTVLNNKLYQISASLQADSMFKFTYYFSNADIAFYKAVFKTLFFHKLLDNRKDFGLVIHSPRPLLGWDVVEDHVENYHNPPWYDRIKNKEGGDKAKNENNNLKKLRAFLKVEISLLKHLSYLLCDKKTKYLPLLPVVHIEEHDAKNLMRPDSGNALLIEIREKSKITQSYLVLSDNKTVRFCDCTDNTSCMEETALLNRIKEQFTREWVKSSNADKLHFVVVGPPGVGKTTIINTMAKKDNKQIESSDDLVNLRLFEKDNPERSRERFQGKNTLPYADERERNEITNRIWEEATKIAIDFAYAKDTYLDLDGKAWMLEEVRLYLKERDYITILLIPETFDEYFNLFARPDLAAAPEKQLEEQLQLINNKRLNVYVAMWKHSCKNYIEYQNQKARNELPDKCMNCEWYKYDYDCEYKTPKDTMWENFKKELNNEIWGKRIDFYNDNPDGTVSRRCGQTVTEIIQDIYKKIEDVKTERKEARQK